MSTSFLFLKITFNSGVVEGDATEQYFENQIALQGLQWESEVEHQRVDDARDVRKVRTINTPRRVKLIKAFDRSTTSLCTFMAARKQFSEASISLLKGYSDTGTARTLIDVILTKGYVEQVGLNASESSLSVAVKESVTLSFETMRIVYHPDSPTGRGDAPPTTFTLEMASEVE